MAESPPVRFVRMLYRHGMRQGSGCHSWQKLNTALYGALCLAIESRMKFARKDFDTIYQKCAGEYWFGTNADGKGMGARLYTTACLADNLSACLAYEHWTGRGPYFWAGKRLYVGGDTYGHDCGFPWDGYQHVLVSTIRSDILIATISEYDIDTSPPNQWCEKCGRHLPVESGSRKPKRIWKIPHETFIAIERLRRKAPSWDGEKWEWEVTTRWIATVDPGKSPLAVPADAVADLSELAALMRPKAKIVFEAREEAAK